MPATTAESFSDVQADVMDLQSAAQQIVGDIDCATGCETKADLIGNLEAAIDNAKELLSDLREQLKRAKASSEEES